MKYLIIILTALISISFSALFLDNGIGLRGMQMAGAYSALALGTDAVYWNQAGLADTSQLELYGAVNTQFDELNQYTALAAIPFGSGTLGIGYYSAGDDNNIRTDVSGNVGNSFAFKDQALYVAYGQKIDSTFKVGAAVKLIAQSAVEQTSFFSSDISLKKSFASDFTASLVFQDAMNNGSIPMSITTGLAHSIGDFVAEVDGNYSGVFTRCYYRAGISYSGLKIIKLSFGYSDYDKNVFGGITTLFGDFSIDYLYSTNDLATSHQFGFGYAF